MHNSATVHRTPMMPTALDSSRSQLCSDTSTGVVRHQITKWRRLQNVVSYRVLHHKRQGAQHIQFVKRKVKLREREREWKGKDKGEVKLCQKWKKIAKRPSRELNLVPPANVADAIPLQYCRVPKNGLPQNGQAGISSKNKNDPRLEKGVKNSFTTRKQCLL